MLELHDLKDNFIRDRKWILKAQKDFYQKLYSEGNSTTLEQSPLHWVTQYIQRISDVTKNKLEEDKYYRNRKCAF